MGMWCDCGLEMVFQWVLLVCVVKVRCDRLVICVVFMIFIIVWCVVCVLVLMMMMGFGLLVLFVVLCRVLVRLVMLCVLSICLLIEQMLLVVMDIMIWFGCLVVFLVLVVGRLILSLVQWEYVVVIIRKMRIMSSMLISGIRLIFGFLWVWCGWKCMVVFSRVLFGLIVLWWQDCVEVCGGQMFQFDYVVIYYVMEVVLEDQCWDGYYQVQCGVVQCD